MKEQRFFNSLFNPRAAGALMKLAAMAFALAQMATTAKAVEYYVDYSNGFDTNAGTAQTTAWQHCPGDVQASANANRTLQPGDTVYFKGGVTCVNPRVNCNSGSLVCAGSTGNISGGGVFTDAAANFSSVQPGDFIYVYNGVTNGVFVESCGCWCITNVTGTNLTFQGFDALADAANRLTYVVCRFITFTSRQDFGSGPAVLDGSGTNRWYFKFGNFNRFSGLTFQNSEQVVTGTNSSDTAWGIIEESGSTPYEGLLVDNCLFTNIYSSTYLGSTPVQYQVFQHNIVQNYCGYGLDTGNYSLVQDNFFTNGIASARSAGAYSVIRFNSVVGMFTINKYHSDCIGPLFSPSASPGSNGYGWIYANWLENDVQGIMFEYNNNGTHDWTVANNVFVGHFGNDGKGQGTSAIIADNSPNLRIYNNIFMGTNNACGWDRAIALDVGPAYITSSTNVSVVENIFYNPSSVMQMGMMNVTNIIVPTLFIHGNHYHVPNYSKGDSADWNVTAGGKKTPYLYSQWTNLLGFDSDTNSTHNVDPGFLHPNDTYTNIDVHVRAGFQSTNTFTNLNVLLRDPSRTFRVRTSLGTNASWGIGAYSILFPASGLKVQSQ